MVKHELEVKNARVSYELYKQEKQPVSQVIAANIRIQTAGRNTGQCKTDEIHDWRSAALF